MKVLAVKMSTNSLRTCFFCFMELNSGSVFTLLMRFQVALVRFTTQLVKTYLKLTFLVLSFRFAIYRCK